MQLSFYFGYMAIASYAFTLMLGSIGFFFEPRFRQDDLQDNQVGLMIELLHDGGWQMEGARAGQLVTVEHLIRVRFGKFYSLFLLCALLSAECQNASGEVVCTHI